MQRERNIIIEGMILPNPPSGGYINALLYGTEKTLGLKKEKVDLQNKQCKFPPFWRTRAWLPRVVTTNDIPPHIPRYDIYKVDSMIYDTYTMVIFLAVLIYHAYEEDSALNHMLTWYKVISVIRQSKFEV